MKLKLFPALILFLSLASLALLAQRRDGPPRRLTDPETIQLTAGSRVEFKTLESATLGRSVDYSIFLPAGYDNSGDTRYPVVYFLHGMFNDHTSWCTERYGNIPSQLESMIAENETAPFVMVHPGGESSFYTDSADGTEKWETYLVQDFLPEIESQFKVSRDRRHRTLGGTSMGGYGALKLAFRHPQLFSAVAAGSPIVLLGDDPLAALSDNQAASPRFTQYFSSIFGRIYGDPFDKVHWKQNSLIELAQASDLNGLRVYLLYGTEDRYNGLVPMEEGVRRLHATLQAHNVNTELRVYEGEGHGWALMVNHLKEVLDFLTKEWR